MDLLQAARAIRLEEGFAIPEIGWMRRARRGYRRMTETDDDFARALTSSRLRSVHQVWKELAAGRIGPKRAAVTPAQLRTSVASTFMIDVIDGGGDFRFRFAGDRIIQFMGQRYAGRLLSELRGTPFFDGMHILYAASTTMMKPHSAGPMRTNFEGREYLEVEVAVFPLSDDEASVSGLLGAFDTWQIGTHTSAG